LQHNNIREQPSWGRISHHLICAISLLNHADDDIDADMHALLLEVRKRHHQNNIK